VQVSRRPHLEPKPETRNPKPRALACYVGSGLAYIHKCLRTRAHTHLYTFLGTRTWYTRVLRYTFLSNGFVWWCAQRNDNLQMSELALAVLSESLKLWPESNLFESSIGHRLWAVACSKVPQALNLTRYALHPTPYTKP
jgi:hypothetical protein